MVFGDVSGFTKMSERLARHGKVGAEEVADAINTCFEQLLGVAYQCGGNLLKFGGDALLLLFTGEDHATRAAHAAVGMRARLREAGRLDTSAGRVVLRISIGVHRGTFHLFMVGGSHRELIVAGPAATSTVAAEGTATAGEIVMSPPTAVVPHRAEPGSGSRGFVPPSLASRNHPRHCPSRPRSSTASTWPATFPPPSGSTCSKEAANPNTAPPPWPSSTSTAPMPSWRTTDRAIWPNGSTPSCGGYRWRPRRTVSRSSGPTSTTTAGKIILVSGVPRRAGEDEQRMLLTLRQIAAEELPLGLRIGVNTGPVFAGDVGTPFRRTFTVMGDTVNLAARLMAKAAPGQVLATADVLDRSSVRFATTALPPFMVKGKTRPVTAYAVGAAHRVTGPPRRPPSADRGRPRSSERSESDLEAVNGGAGRVVEIVGDQGTGKSRLVEELARRAGTMPDHDHHLRELRGHDPLRLRLVSGPGPARTRDGRRQGHRGPAASGQGGAEAPELLPAATR